MYLLTHIHIHTHTATDSGKKDLPRAVRHRFSEFYINEVQDKEDITLIVKDYLSGINWTKNTPVPGEYSVCV
jgi:midasin (ATPase involved in ribosome maturation)